MNKRAFLQSIAAISAGLAIPVKVKGFDKLIVSDLDLIELCERTFQCQIGAPWAFVEPRPAWADVALMDDDPRWRTLTPYFTMKAEDYDNPSKILLALLQNVVAVHPEIVGTPLYWRRPGPEKIIVSESWYQDHGALVLSQEQYEDDGNDWPTAEQAAAMTPEIRQGLERYIERQKPSAVPIPKGCIDDCYSGNIYLAVGDPWAVRSARLRIAIPALQALAQNDIEHAVTLPATYEASGRLRIEGAFWSVSKAGALQV